MSELPLVLSGPIVRRTEPHQVCVWVALSEAATVELTVFESDGGARGVERASGRRDTVRLAQRLHVAAVTAPVEQEAVKLDWGAEYLYQLSFEVDGASHGLYDDGVLTHGDGGGDLERLRYPGRELPGFRLPAAELDAVRLVHGSCRKAHGDGADALVTVDALLAEDDPPQQLFLTGDQIYADNVDPAVLTAIMAVGEELIGEPDPEKAEELGAFADLLRPGERQALVAQHADFTSGSASCHLVTLAEFYVMYLLAWSDVFWDRVDLGPSGDKKRQKALDALKTFRDTLPGVRRALANVSTYMIFDDHEVSDDWNLTREWVERTTSSELGPRIFRNALVSYALFQHWGNEPDAFAEGAPGGALLDAVDGWDGTAGTAAEQVRERVYVAPPGRSLEPVPDGALAWHYTVDAPQHRVVALDCRTRRRFSGPATPPGLMSAAAIDEVIDVAEPIKPATIVLSPTPVLGVLAIETVQRLLIRLLDTNLVNSDPDSVDPEAWSFDPEIFEHLLDRLARLRRVVVLSGDVHYGFAASLVGRDVDARIVNFVSSSLHNQTFAQTASRLINLGASRLEAVGEAGEEVEEVELPATTSGSTNSFAWEEELLPEHPEMALEAPAGRGVVELEAFEGSRRRDAVVGSCNVGDVVFGGGEVEHRLRWTGRRDRARVTRHVATFPVDD